MKKQVMVEKAFCDVCGKEASGYSNCIICGKEFCYECGDKESIEYRHSTCCSGSGDGRYCLECDKNAMKSGDKLHAAYRQILSLRNEASGFYSDYNERSKKAEETLKALLK